MTRPIPGADLDPLFRFLSARTGLRFPDHRRVATEAAIRRSMAEAGLGSVGEYVRLLHEDARLFSDIVAEVTIGETYFFREPHHFEFLQQEALPALERRWGDSARFQFWSAGCASGEEAYSLAIVLHESGRAARSSILATDINRRALGRAREAVYQDWSLRGVSEPTVRRFFRPIGGRWRLADHISRLVRFSWDNLADPAPGRPLGTADVILCRNVLIHLEPEVVARIGRRLFERLTEGGWLLTGSSDPSLATAAPFDCVASDHGVCYRRPVHQRGAAPVASTSRRPSQPVAPAHRPIRRREEILTTPPVDVQDVADAFGAMAGLRTAEQLLHHKPLSASLHLVRALLLVELGRGEDAVLAARRAAALESSGGVARLVLLGILRRRGDHAGAAAWARPGHSGRVRS